MDLAAPTLDPDRALPEVDVGRVEGKTFPNDPSRLLWATAWEGQPRPL
jgi:hypothetical protein